MFNVLIAFLLPFFDYVNNCNYNRIIKKCAAEATHKKHIAPIVAKQTHTTHRVYAEKSICIFYENKKIHILSE